MPRRVSFIQYIRAGALLSGILLAVAHQSVFVSPMVDHAFFAFFVFVLGIPHGALDHLIEARLHTLKGQRFSLYGFLALYLVQMGLYAVCWLFFPTVSLLLFLLMSAWHFGESDMEPAPQGVLWGITKFTLGLMVLFFILMREPLLTGEIIFRITRGNAVALDVWEWLSDIDLTLYALWMVSFPLLYFWANRQKSMATPYIRLAYFLPMVLTMYFLPLLPAFALYFGAWHALNTFQQMNQFLSDHPHGHLLWSKAIPFSIAAMLFLLLFGLLWKKSFAHMDPMPVVFIFIAIITLPHLMVMHKMIRSGIAK